MKKTTLAVAALLASLSTAVIVPVAFADDTAAPQTQGADAAKDGACKGACKGACAGSCTGS